MPEFQNNAKSLMTFFFHGRIGVSRDPSLWSLIFLYLMLVKLVPARMQNQCACANIQNTLPIIGNLVINPGMYVCIYIYFFFFQHIYI